MELDDALSRIEDVAIVNQYSQTLSEIIVEEVEAIRKEARQPAVAPKRFWLRDGLVVDKGGAPVTGADLKPGEMFSVTLAEPPGTINIVAGNIIKSGDRAWIFDGDGFVDMTVLAPKAEG